MRNKKETNGENSTMERLTGWLMVAVFCGIIFWGVFLVFSDYKQIIDSGKVSKIVLEGIEKNCLEKFKINYSLLPKCEQPKCSYDKTVIFGNNGSILLTYRENNFNPAIKFEVKEQEK